MLGVNIDITGRRQAEEAKSNLAAIVESSNDAILSKTLDGSSLPPVRGDRVQLQQVLLNLLLNAMDAVKGSAPDRRLVTVRVQPAGTRVEVAVSDAGHGIPTDKLVRLFEPFFTTKPNGMGMGLPISQRIMEAHGGSIRAENVPDGGATFFFSLPVAMRTTRRD